MSTGSLSPPSCDLSISASSFAVFHQFELVSLSSLEEKIQSLLDLPKMGLVPRTGPCLGTMCAQYYQWQLS